MSEGGGVIQGRGNVWILAMDGHATVCLSFWRHAQLSCLASSWRDPTRRCSCVPVCRPTAQTPTEEARPAPAGRRPRRRASERRPGGLAVTSPSAQRLVLSFGAFLSRPPVAVEWSRAGRAPISRRCREVCPPAGRPTSPGPARRLSTPTRIEPRPTQRRPSSHRASLCTAIFLSRDV